MSVVFYAEDNRRKNALSETLFFSRRDFSREYFRRTQRAGMYIQTRIQQSGD